jgi:hypothetical protein
MSQSPGEDAVEDAPAQSPTPTSDNVDVFGSVLPEQTADDRDGGDWRDDVGPDRDDDIRADVPPHY